MMRREINNGWTLFISNQNIKRVNELTKDQITQIREMRKADKNYVFISKALGINRDKISDFCKVEGIVTEWSTHCYSNTRKVARKILASKQREIGDKKNTFTCKNCGKVYIRRRRIHDEGKTYCCRECAYEDMAAWYVGPKERDIKPEMSCKVLFTECSVCEKMFTARMPNACFCSDECRQSYNYKKARMSYRRRNGLVLEAKKCVVCGKNYESWDKRNTTCSSLCAKKYYHRLSKATRRARERDAFVETVSVQYLFERDQGRCQICGKKLNRDRQVPHPMAMTIDHIIPLSLGGEHSKKNTQLACFRCNSLKGNRVIEGGEQLRLFG